MKQRGFILAACVVAILYYFHGLAHAQQSQGKVLVQAKLLSPESIVRLCLVAVATQDRELFRSIIIPIPDKDVDELMNKGSSSSDSRKKQSIESYMQIPLKRLRQGDKFDIIRTSESGEAIIIPKSRHGNEFAFITYADAATPFLVRKVNGRWLMDTSPLLAIRKAGKTAKDSVALGIAAKAAKKAYLKAIQ